MPKKLVSRWSFYQNDDVLRGSKVVLIAYFLCTTDNLTGQSEFENSRFIFIDGET